MPTSSSTVTDAASGNEVATQTITEDALTKHLQRVMVDNRLNTPAEKYMATLAPVGGITAVTTGATNMAGIRKLAANPDVYITRISVTQVNAILGTVVPIVMYRATTVAGGTLIAVANIPKFDTAAGNSTLELRHLPTAITGTTIGVPMWVFIPGAGSGVAGAGMTADTWTANDRSEWLRLTGDEGLLFQNTLAADTDNRVYINLTWEEAS